MSLLDVGYFAARERAELEMAAAADSSAAAHAHKTLAVLYRGLIDDTVPAARKPCLNRTAADGGTPASQAITASLFKSLRSRPDSDSQAATAISMQCEIETRFDDRGMAIYVLVENGIDLTSRWTRADADGELRRANVPQRAAPASK
jgi:hypothetical protein